MNKMLFYIIFLGTASQTCTMESNFQSVTAQNPASLLSQCIGYVFGNSDKFNQRELNAKLPLHIASSIKNLRKIQKLAFKAPLIELAKQDEEVLNRCNMATNRMLLALGTINKLSEQDKLSPPLLKSFINLAKTVEQFAKIIDKRFSTKEKYNPIFQELVNIIYNNILNICNNLKAILALNPQKQEIERQFSETIIDINTIIQNFAEIIRKIEGRPRIEKFYYLLPSIDSSYLDQLSDELKKEIMREAIKRNDVDICNKMLDTQFPEPLFRSINSNSQIVDINSLDYACLETDYALEGQRTVTDLENRLKIISDLVAHGRKVNRYHIEIAMNAMYPQLVEFFIQQNHEVTYEDILESWKRISVRYLERNPLQASAIQKILQSKCHK